VKGNTFELLRRCTVEHDWTVAPEGVEAMLAGTSPRLVGKAAADHGVANLVFLSTRELPALDPELRSLLGTVHQLNLTHHMKVIGELTALAGTLDAAGVPFMVVKGPVLSEVVYPRNDMRSYGDLDLVIGRRFFGDAVTALLESGCDMLDRNWRVIRREMRGQVHMTARFGTSADVHWHLINRASVRGSFTIDMDELFARARRVSLDGPSVLTLDPEDTLIHLSLHAGLSGAVKLAWLKDIERACTAPQLAWDEVVARAHRFGTAEVVAISLRRARELLGADVPPEVISELGGSRVWLGIVRSSERLSPNGRPPNQPSLARAVTRATRSGLRSSLRALVARLGDDLAKYGDRPFGRRRAILASGGDESDRMAYFEAIQSGRIAA
jgi:Uncharacterised nucleotidyltransferase